MAGRQGSLFSDAASDESAVAVNGRCIVRSDGGHRVIVVQGLPVAHFAVDDAMAEAHAMVSLVENGWATQREVAVAFGCTTRTVRRHQRRYEVGGLAALGRPSGYPSGRPRAPRRRTALVEKLKSDGKSFREIAARVGVSEKAIRNQLRRLGWRPPVVEQAALALGADPKVSAPVGAPVAPTAPLATPAADPKVSAPVVAPVAPTAPLDTPAADPKVSAPVEDSALPQSLDPDPADRRVDRMLAHAGLLDDAAPLFRDGDRILGAGVLLAIPALVESGVFDVARNVYKSLAPAFYGLRTTVAALCLMALSRIKRPEALKEHSPSVLGRILGLDRAPEMKTLRRKLRRLAAVGRATEFGRELARRRIAARPETVGFLYVDGHVRVYHGKQDIPKAHVTRMRIALPATTDYWGNDAAGDPLFVVTAEANAGMVKMLPPLLAAARDVAGAERRITVVFDRGGWSPRLFKQLVDGGFDFITYRKGKILRIPRRQFTEHTAVFDGKSVSYELADRIVTFLGGSLVLRQVSRLRDDKKHQTHIITSRRDLSTVEVAFRMFERWRQENFFKYMREEYALDALVDHTVEPDDPEREVPNPKWADADAKLHAAREHVNELKREIGLDAALGALDMDGKRDGPSLDGDVRRALFAALETAAKVRERRDRIPRRIPVGRRQSGVVVKLSTERKHLTNVIKMVAYQAESDLCRLIAPHFHRAADEGRTLVQTAFANDADIRVTDGELRVTLAPLSAPHRTAAVAELCRELDGRRVRFPGTRLVMRYGMAPA